MGLMKQRWTQIVDEEAVDVFVDEEDMDDPLQEIVMKLEDPAEQDLPCDAQLKLEFHTTWHSYK